jgi:hypothetical protein
MSTFDETPLSKAEFLKLYGKCGDVLHRGDLKRLFRGITGESSDYGEINSWSKKLTDLLTNHCITLAKTESFILCFNDANNKVKVAIGDWHEPGQYLV